MGREPILVREMKEAKVYKGKQLSATVVEEVLDVIGLYLDDGFVGPSAIFTIADDEGSIIQVQVLHVARNGVAGIVPTRMLREIYPVGSRIIIKDPFLPSLPPSGIVVRHPAKLEVVRYFPQEVILTAAEVRDLGNIEFNKGRFLAALKWYELALGKVMTDGRIDEDEAVRGLSDKAACFLQIGDFERAYSSYCSALKLQPDNPRLLAKLGVAYLGLQEYELASQVLAQAAEVGHYAGCAMELGQARTLALQASSGDYGKVLKSWFLHKCVGDPEVSDYIGPVEIRMTAGKEAGLFATADVPAGALLLVSNAVSFERKVPHLFVMPAVVSKVFMECIKSPDLLERIYSLPESSTNKEVPPMSFFGANRMVRGGRDVLSRLKDYTPDQEVDFDRIRDIVESCTYSKYLDDEKHIYSALWLLPAFAKHSCVPNMSKLDVGTAAFFHANRDIKAGEELTFSWCWSALRWETFESECWDCNCKRCKVEEKLLADKLRPLQTAYKESTSGKSAEDRAKLAALAPVIEEAMAAGSAEEKGLLRTSFAAAFVEYYLLLQPGVAAQSGEVAPVEVVIQDLRDYAPGSFRTIRKLGSSITSDDFSRWIGSQAVSGEVVDAIMSMKDPDFVF